MTRPRADVRICQDYETLVQRAADAVRAAIRHAIRARGRAAIATSNGSTARRIIELLASDLRPGEAHVFGACACWGRGRNDPAGAGDWLAQLPIPKQNMHVPSLDYADPHSAASAFEQQVRAFFGVPVGEFPRFDVVLLQLGADAGAASLAPFSSSLDETGRLVVANYVRARGRQCVTLTAPFINHARLIVLLATGRAIAPALRAMVYGAFEPHRIPAQLLQPMDGTLQVFADLDAADALPPARHARTPL
jgi:6-phosphogluconolactonase